MDAFVQPLYELADFDAIIRQLKKPGIVQVSGCLDSQKAHFTNGLLREFPFRLIVAENDLKAKAFYEDFRLYKTYLSSHPLPHNLEIYCPRRPGRGRLFCPVCHKRGRN